MESESLFTCSVLDSTSSPDPVSIHLYFQVGIDRRLRSLSNKDNITGCEGGRQALHIPPVY